MDPKMIESKAETGIYVQYNVGEISISFRSWKLWQALKKRSLF
jgi:hypothetical protein